MARYFGVSFLTAACNSFSAFLSAVYGAAGHYPHFDTACFQASRRVYDAMPQPWFDFNTTPPAPASSYANADGSYAACRGA